MSRAEPLDSLLQQAFDAGRAGMPASAVVSHGVGTDWSGDGLLAASVVWLATIEEERG